MLLAWLRLAPSHNQNYRHFCFLYFQFSKIQLSHKIRILQNQPFAAQLVLLLRQSAGWSCLKSAREFSKWSRNQRGNDNGCENGNISWFLKNILPRFSRMRFIFAKRKTSFYQNQPFFDQKRLKMSNRLILLFGYVF